MPKNFSITGASSGFGKALMRARLAGLLFLFLASSMSKLCADDGIILNGNFSDGKTHWHGDGDVPDAGGKLVITLQPDKWTVVSQDFTAESKELQLRVTYALSADCSLAVKKSADALLAPFTSQDLEQATGLETRIPDIVMSPNYQWLTLLVSGEAYRGYHPVMFTSSKANPRTFVTMLTDPRQFNDESLCLAFPPGTGTVTITNVQLVAPPGT